METKKCYYIAGGRTLATIEAYCESKRQHLKYMRGLADELGSADMYGDARVRLFSIPASGMPKGWSKAYKPGTMAPKATKAGNLWRDRMDAAPYVPTGADLAQTCGLTYEARDVDGEMVFAGLGFERHGEHFVAMTHQLADRSSLGGDPLDCERIPDSRYWKIREDAAVSKGV